MVFELRGIMRWADPGARQQLLRAGGDPSWSMFLSALSGWHKWYRLRDAGHYRFIDLGGSVRKRGLE